MATPAHTPQAEAPLDVRQEAGPEGVEPASTPDRPTPQEIAREAYLIYLANGEQDGRHEEDWYEAEFRLSRSSGSRQPFSTPQQAAAQMDEVDTRDRTPG